jgi:hypothetical protein
MAYEHDAVLQEKRHRAVFYHQGPRVHIIAIKMRESRFEVSCKRLAGKLREEYQCPTKNISTHYQTAKQQPKVQIISPNIPFLDIMSGYLSVRKKNCNKNNNAYGHDVVLQEKRHRCSITKGQGFTLAYCRGYWNRLQCRLD